MTTEQLHVFVALFTGIGLGVCFALAFTVSGWFAVIPVAFAAGGLVESKARMP